MRKENWNNRLSIQHMLLLSCAMSLSMPACGNAAEFSGIPVNPSMLPNEVVKPIPIEITTDQFKARLKEGGTLTLDGNELVLGPADASKKSAAFLALDRLELKNGAKIITNGNVLTIFVNSIQSENGQIRSFTAASAKATGGPAATARGEDGHSGDPGSSGGVVSIHVIGELDGILNVDLQGQEGGNGSDGMQGVDLPQASRGRDAEDGPGGWLTPGWCKHGGADGDPGKKGLQGGSAGAGGRGGDGGHFQLINVGSKPIPAANYTFSAEAGKNGTVGQPGKGGPGQKGGEGGHGSTWCSGGRAGGNGPDGDPGPVPQETSAAAPGTSAVKNLDLEVVVRSSIIAQGPQ